MINHIFLKRCLLTIISISLFACSKSESIESTVLYDFENKTAFDNIQFKCKTRFQLSTLYKKHGKSSLEIKFYPADMVGFILNNINVRFNRNDFLSIWIYNPNEPKQIFIQVNLKNKSSFAEVYPIQYGENIVRIAMNKYFIKYKNILESVTIYQKKVYKINMLYFDEIILH